MRAGSVWSERERSRDRGMMGWGLDGGFDMNACDVELPFTSIVGALFSFRQRVLLKFEELHPFSAVYWNFYDAQNIPILLSTHLQVSECQLFAEYIK